jgi:hypothetical protein
LNRHPDARIVDPMTWSWRRLAALACVALVLCASLAPGGLALALPEPTFELLAVLSWSDLPVAHHAAAPLRNLARLTPPRAPPTA